MIGSKRSRKNYSHGADLVWRNRDPLGSQSKDRVFQAKSGYPGFKQNGFGKCYGDIGSERENHAWDTGKAFNPTGDVFKKVSVLSGGERVKLAFAKLFGSPANLLLLDEPTNFLDMPAIEALQQMVEDYEGTVLFVSHDRTFLEECATRDSANRG